MSNRTRQERIIAIALIAVIILLLVNAYLLYDKINNDKIIDQQKQELVEVNSLKNDMEEEYYEAISELESLKTDNEDLNQLIEEQKTKLKNQKDKIDDLLVSQRNLAAARSELKKLKNNIDSYLTDIERLRSENDSLAMSNEALLAKNQKLSSEITKERTQRSALEEENEDLLTAREKLLRKQARMDKKISRASVIDVSEMIVEGFKVSSSGKLRPRRKARNIDLLKICFTTTENVVVDEAEETFYVRIINPTGETIAVEPLGSGVIQSQANQELMRYTISATVDYTLEPQNVCVDWSPTSPFMEGIYEIEVYNKGYRAGKATFEMR